MSGLTRSDGIRNLPYHCAAARRFDDQAAERRIACVLYWEGLSDVTAARENSDMDHIRHNNSLGGLADSERRAGLSLPVAPVVRATDRRHRERHNPSNNNRLDAYQADAFERRGRH